MRRLVETGWDWLITDKDQVWLQVPLTMRGPGTCFTNQNSELFLKGRVIHGLVDFLFGEWPRFDHLQGLVHSFVEGILAPQKNARCIMMHWELLVLMKYVIDGNDWLEHSSLDSGMRKHYHSVVGLLKPCTIWAFVPWRFPDASYAWEIICSARPGPKKRQQGSTKCCFSLETKMMHSSHDHCCDWPSTPCNSGYMWTPEHFCGSKTKARFAPRRKPCVWTMGTHMSQSLPDGRNYSYFGVPGPRNRSQEWPAIGVPHGNPRNSRVINAISNVLPVGFFGANKTHI